MSKGTSGKRHIYGRDILRDYALASFELAAQFERFEESGVISFSILRGILGEAHSKGLLWQIKDSARHLLSDSGRAGGKANPWAEYLDWALGFLFHECMIALESGYQMQKYYPAAQGFAPSAADPGLEGARLELSLLAAETRDGLARGIGRIRRLLKSINLLMCAYLAEERKNGAHSRPLARLCYDREELLRSVFKNRYAELCAGVFGPEPGRLPLEAAWSLFESGHTIRAEHAAQKALAQNPALAEASELLDKIAQVRQ